ncbi:hypothetical protein B9Z55_000190 [Caenorhabditis nigoni]|uniref:F-box associated domain-containing protein n=2 Tax=Caenorhabditis nigoni TaxID=1611254 RepID=A0A2G5VI62_9PELO|nr:hypothetical protein B9Z55_000190 [Caenorhabditis nigoni]
MELDRLLFCDTKTVLSYMEPNFRFNLALKIPSIRRAEKAAPLYIKHLDLHDTRFVVNETEYKIRVFRECQAKTKKFGGDWAVQTKNKPFPVGLYQVPGIPRGEVNYDFDEYGYKINLDESIQPGDKLLTEAANLNWRRGSKVDELEYECQEKNARPCNHYIRLYVSGCKYQFPYTNMKMYQLMRRLLTVLFGNRNGEWTIKNMNFGNNVLRWPRNGWKPIVRNVNIFEYSHVKLNAVHSIIGLSVPLISLKMSFPFLEPTIRNHPLFKTSEHLIVSNIPWRSFTNLFSIQTHKVSLTIRSLFNVEQLIDIWMEKRRPIGVYYSFLTNSKQDLARISHPEVLQKSTDCIKLKMGNEAVVVFRYTMVDSKYYLTIETFSKT